MVEIYADGIKKAISELDLDAELREFAAEYLGKMVKTFSIVLGLLLLPLSGCSSYHEFSQEYGIGKNKPYRILNRCTPTVWMRLLRRTSIKLQVKIVKKYHQMSAATKSRHKVTLVVDSTTLLKLAQELGLVGVFWSGKLKKTASSIQLVVLYAVIGEGKLLIPLDMRIREPESQGKQCKEQPELVLEMVRNLRTRCRIKGIDPCGWFIVMDSWYGSKDLLDKISELGFIMAFEGKSNYVFFLNKEKFNAAGLAEEIEWRDSNQRDIEYARVNVTSPTFGEVTLVLFQDAGELKYLVMKPNLISAVRVIVAYKLRWWIEEFFKICKSYLNIEKFQMVKENEVYGHICLRIICFIVVCFCARRICRETIQKIVRKLNRYWFEWFPEILDSHTFSSTSIPKSA
jgi:hypothetical protein